MTADCSDVVIVSYRSARHLRACLDSVAAQQPGVGLVTVVDNGSDDRSVAVAGSYAGVEVLRLDRNIGFAAAANRGVAAGSASTVLLLNPDAVLDEGALSHMRSVLLGDAALGAVTGAIRGTDGKPYPSARQFPSLVTAAGHGLLGLIRPDNRWSREYLAPDTPDWIAGTAMLISRHAFEAVGGFDERYFMYVEDVDLCWRFRQRGFRVAVVPEAGIAHEIGGSTESRPYRMVVEHHRSLWRFAVRTRRGAAAVALPGIAVGLAVRTVLAVAARSLSRRPPAALHRA